MAHPGQVNPIEELAHAMHGGGIELPSALRVSGIRAGLGSENRVLFPSRSGWQPQFRSQYPGDRGEACLCPAEALVERASAGQEMRGFQ